MDISMGFELILLGALIFIFIMSFCGLLQKIKQTYDRERLLAARIALRREQQRIQRRSASFSEIYVNPSFITDANGNVYPTPPPYTQCYMEPPPKYDDIIKVPQSNLPSLQTAENDECTSISNESSPVPSNPPPYTVIVRTTDETTVYM